MNLETLLANGYFPRELPPPFNTIELAKKYLSLKDSLSGTIDKKPSRCLNYSIAKIGLVRKSIKIPNPMHHIPLCEVITDNWDAIGEIYKSSSLSCSKPKFAGKRAANPMIFKDFSRMNFLESYPYSYELKTDISKYYPTIYTHSIPWAIHGKDTAKANRTDRTLLGNKLDHCLQQTMYGQTIGIPIGPDTSLIIAEIIGCTIDRMISEEIPGIKGYRYVDDMYFFFHSYSDAEAALLKIQHVLKEFELQINAEKTLIRKLPRGIEPEWLVQLRSFEIRSESELKQYNDIISFFSLSFDLANNLQNEYVLSYALAKIKRVEPISDRNFALLEAMLLKTIIAEPSTIKEVFRILFTYQNRVHITKIQKVLSKFIVINSERGYDYELSWALWIVKSFKITLEKEVVAHLTKINDTISMLIVLDLLDCGLINSGDLDLSSWKTKLENESLMNENWLFAYEVGLKRWIAGCDYSYIDDVPYFKILRKHKISFYDPNRQITPIDVNKKEDINTEAEVESTHLEVTKHGEIERISEEELIIKNEDSLQFDDLITNEGAGNIIDEVIVHEYENPFADLAVDEDFNVPFIDEDDFDIDYF